MVARMSNYGGRSGRAPAAPDLRAIAARHVFRNFLVNAAGLIARANGTHARTFPYQ